MARAFTPYTINKFKGWRSSVPPGAIEDNEFATLINWNVTDQGTLEKRKGLYNAIATVYGAVGAGDRMLAIQRSNLVGDFVFWTDGAKLYRAALPNVTANTELKIGAASIPNVQWAVEVTGTAANTSQMQCICQPGNTVLIAENGTGTAQTGPPGTFGTWFKNRLWVINNLFANGTESRIWYSELNDFNNWPGTYIIDVQPGDGQYINCIVPYNDQLIIFKNQSTFVLTAEGDRTSWQVRMLNPTIGCAGRGTAKIINGFIYFYSGNGVYRTDGTTYEEVSRPIRDQFSLIPYDLSTLANQCDAVFWDNKYILKLSNSATQCYVYDVYADTWTLWQFTAGVSTNGFASYDEYASSSFYTVNPANGKLMKMGPNWWVDDSNVFTGGTNYPATAYGKLFNLGAPTKWKRNHLSELEYGQASGVGDTLGLGYQKDGATVVAAVNKTVANGPQSAVLRYPGAGRARSIQPRISHAGSGQCTVYGVSMEVETREEVGKTL